MAEFEPVQVGGKEELIDELLRERESRRKIMLSAKLILEMFVRECDEQMYAHSRGFYQVNSIRYFYNAARSGAVSCDEALVAYIAHLTNENLILQQRVHELVRNTLPMNPVQYDDFIAKLK